jgi:hypothetical protein
MREELDKKLVEDFPILYSQRHLGPMETCMCWGFECGNGWEPLLRRLSTQLDLISKSFMCGITVTQVKEKYGTLRFYYNTDASVDVDTIIRACVYQAEALSGHICEECGEAGEANDSGWISVRCEDHRR